MVSPEISDKRTIWNDEYLNAFKERGRVMDARHPLWSGVRRLVSHPAWAFCAVVFASGVLPDLDHLLPGAARTTHLAVAVLAWCCLGAVIALSSRRRRAVVLGVRT